MPAIPPIAVKITEEKEKTPAPQRDGKNPPTAEPINNPIQIRGFDFIILFQVFPCLPAGRFGD